VRIVGEDFEQGEALDVAGAAQASGDGVEVGVVVAGMADDLPQAVGEGIESVAKGAGVEASGGGDADGAVGGADGSAADLRELEETGAQHAHEADLGDAHAVGAADAEAPGLLEWIANGADAGALGDCEQRTRDHRQNVGVFVGIEVGDGDAGGLQAVTIFASGNLDEYRLSRLLAERAPIDGFGIGVNLDASIDAPSLDCAYKLQEYNGTPKRKLSEGKQTWPGRKQVWRTYGTDGTMNTDVLGLESDAPAGEPLIAPVMRGGKRIAPAPTLAQIRERAAGDLKRLPEPLRRLQPGTDYPVKVAESLVALAKEADARTKR